MKKRKFWLIIIVTGVVSLSFLAYQASSVVAVGDSSQEIASEAERKEFFTACDAKAPLAWVTCPVMWWLAGAVDGLTNLVEGFFE